jgi:adhesin/invasin
MFRLYAIAVVTVLAVVACDSVPLTAPTQSTISISIDKPVLPINGQATVRAVVIELSGTPVHNGTMVTFQPSIGSVNPPEAPTVNGIATSTFLAGPASGSGVIHAFSGGTRTGSGNSSSGGVDVKVGAAAAGSVSVSATPSSVSQSGGTVTIAALVLDPSGNPLPGVNVTFSADAGQLSSTLALSDSSGIARTQLTTTQTSKVTATAGTATKDVTVTVTAAPTVSITAENGTEGVPLPITVSIAATGATPARQIQTLTVDFGDGTSESRSNVTGSVGFTHTYNQARGFTINATAVDVAGNTGVASKAIVITRQQNPTVTLTAPATTTVAVPIAVTFSATSPAAGSQIVSARVTLQDGTVIYSGSNANSFNYKFGGPGTYTLTGTVTDSNGNSASASTTVFVSP